VVTSDEGPFVRTRAEPDRKRLGPRLGKDVNKVAQAVLSTFCPHLPLSLAPNDDHFSVELSYDIYRNVFVLSDTCASFHLAVLRQRTRAVN
jgi:hypothetical protein